MCFPNINLLVKSHRFYKHYLIVWIWFCLDVFYVGNMPQGIGSSWGWNGCPQLIVFRKWGRKVRGQLIKLVHIWTGKPDSIITFKVQLRSRGWACWKPLFKGNLRKKHLCPNELEKMLAEYTLSLTFSRTENSNITHNKQHLSCS